jgi:hypothetical protein
VSRALAVLLLGALLSCSGGESQSNVDDGSQFVAFPTSFNNYRQWETFPLGDMPPEDPAHTANPRTVYLNQRPPHGATQFPVGTMIVKEMGTPGAADYQVLAMVKRGGNFNTQGAPGWEWLEIDGPDDNPVKGLIWRGVGPPAGEKYGGDPNAACNPCHATARDNDFVKAQPLRLSSF